MQFFRGKTNKIRNKNLIDYLVMKNMRWSYWELMSTPQSVVNRIIKYMYYEGLAQKEQMDAKQ